MVDLDETDLSDQEKAFRVRALVAAIDEDGHGNPAAERLQEDAIDLLDDLAAELQAAEDR